jgi:hypothetical protein
MGTFVTALGQEKFVNVQEVSMVREKLACAVDLQSMDLVQRGELIPSGLCARHLGRLCWRFENALLSCDICFLIRICHVMPVL